MSVLINGMEMPKDGTYNIVHIYSDGHVSMPFLGKGMQIMQDVNAVPVVRCKDCVHCADDWNGNQPMFTCELGMCGESVQPNDFCSYGERRSE